MITVKQYAEDRNITIQAVHQSMKGKRKKGLLEGHVHMVDGIKWLDDEAVAILDKDRRKPPVIFEREDANAAIDALEQERDLLLHKIAAQADRIAELAQWQADKALEIASAEQTRLLLTAAEQEKRLLEGFIADAKAEIAALGAEKAQAEAKTLEATETAQKAQDELTAAQGREQQLRDYLAALDAWHSLSWFKRKNRKKFPKPTAPALQEG